MKERPILFSAPMVRAILNGSKTQTRRVVKPQPTGFVGGPGVTFCDGSPAPLVPMNDFAGSCGQEIVCPYGDPGDRLFVRETYWRDEEDGAILYAANPDDFEVVHHNKVVTGSERYKWKPSIFMPRWASRITLEVTGVRVERLQDISEADAQAEGCTAKLAEESPALDDSRHEYRDLWESINGPGSWDLNPWVWVVEFKRETP